MIKGKRGLALAMSLIAISLTACGDDYTYPEANWTDGKIVTIGGQQFTFDNDYKYFEGTKSSAQSYFSVAKNILAQTVTTRTDAILSIVDTKIEKLHDTWKTNARTNGTSYKEEQEKTFNSEGVEDEDELREKYIADEQISQNSDAFLTVKDGTNNVNEQYYLSEDHTKNYVEDNAPYHVSHVLIKVDASSSGEGFYNGQISADDAKQIDSVVRSLVSSTTFGRTAQLLSDDSSNTQYGELYTNGSMIAMQKDTSYVNEFKLGVYAYDTFLNDKTKNNTTAGDNAAVSDIRASLRVPGTTDGAVADSEVAESISDTLAGQGKAFGIPLSACFQMAQIAETDANPIDGSSVTTVNKKSVSARQYPRNILFNNYFNYRGVSFIYNDNDEYPARFLQELKDLATFYSENGNAKAAAFGNLANAITVTGANDSTVQNLFISPEFAAVEDELSYKVKEYNYVSRQLGNAQDSKFVDFSGELVNYASNATTSSTTQDTTLNNAHTSKKILADENGNAVIVARAGTSGDSGYQGLHFIVVNNDPFTADGNGAYTNKYQYYRVNVPGAVTVADTDEAASTLQGTAAYSANYAKHPSFINFVSPDSTSNTTYNGRRESVEKVIKAALDSEEIALWEYNLEQFKTKYNADFTSYLGKTTVDGKEVNIADLISQYVTLTKESSVESANDSLDGSWETYIKEINLETELATQRMIPTIGIAAFESGNLTAAMEEICYVD
jgi:hypothetical protein